MSRYDRDEAPDDGLGAGYVALLSAAVAGTVVLSFLVWRRFDPSLTDVRRSHRLIRKLDSARGQLRRQISAGDKAAADETRIRIGDLQQAIMQLEGYI